MKMFVCVVATALLAAANVHAGVVGVLSTGASSQHRSEDGLGNYAFGYDEGHATGGSFRKESGNALGVKVGSYGLRDADGRVRTVNYVADAAGFRASVSTNEPGTAPSLPAAASYNAAPVVAKVVAAPIVAAAPSYAAPVAVAAPVHHVYAHHHVAAPLAAVPAHHAYAHHVAAPLAAVPAPRVYAHHIAAPLAAIPAPAQYAANVFAPSGTPYAW